MDIEKMILHIMRPDEWEKVKNNSYYYPDTIHGEGFIHCSNFQQILSVAEILFKCEKHLKLLYIDPDEVDAKVVYEDLYKSGEQFPHIYGGLNLDAVVKTADLKPDHKGSFLLEGVEL